MSFGIEGSNLLLFVALLTKVLPSASHFSTSHSVFLGGQMLLDLDL